MSCHPVPGLKGHLSCFSLLSAMFTTNLLYIALMRWNLLFFFFTAFFLLRRDLRFCQIFCTYWDDHVTFGPWFYFFAVLYVLVCVFKVICAVLEWNWLYHRYVIYLICSDWFICIWREILPPNLSRKLFYSFLLCFYVTFDIRVILTHWMSMDLKSIFL